MYLYNFSSSFPYSGGLEEISTPIMPYSL